MGARIYADKDATTFNATAEYEFEWYRGEKTEWSAELEEEVVYNDEDTQAEVKEAKALPAVDASTIASLIDKLAELLAEYEALVA